MFRMIVKPFNFLKTAYSVAIWAVFLFLSIAAAQAASVTLAWDSVANATGYKLGYGSASGAYTTTVDVVGATSRTITDLTEGSTYYFAVKAYNGTAESAYSTPPVSYTVPYAAPVASISATPTTTGPAPLAVTFTGNATGSVTTWAWNFGDGTPAGSGKTVSHSYSSAGTYTATLTATGSGDSNSATTTITVTAPAVAAPVASFTVSPTKGTTATAFTFTNTSTGTTASTTWAWSFGDGTSSSDRSPVKNYTKAGTYTVSLTATVGSVSSKAPDQQIVVTEAPPLVDFSASPTSGTTATQFTFTNNSTGATASTTWAWSFGDGSTDSIKSPTKYYSKPGVYTVSLTATGSGGKDTATKTNYISVLLGQDIGSVGSKGSTAYTNGTYTLKGSGTDIWGKTDAFHFAYRPLNGDGTIVAQVASMTNTNSWAKAGVMIRESLSANSKHAMVVVTPSNGVAFQRRTATGSSSYHTAGAANKAPYWVKLTRSGNTFTAYQSADGSNWTTIGSATISMATAFVGLAVTSHNNTLLNTATLDKVSIK